MSFGPTTRSRSLPSLLRVVACTGSEVSSKERHSVSSARSVTVYLPCYNVARYVAATIEGLLRQTRPPAEILIIDDGCTDDTLTVAGRYPVRVVTHGGNRGLATARNTALRAAHTPFIASLDTDAVPEPD